MDHGTTATANAKPMNHGSESGCCGHMAMSKGDGRTMLMAVDDPSMIAQYQGRLQLPARSPAGHPSHRQRPAERHRHVDRIRQAEDCRHVEDACLGHVRPSEGQPPHSPARSLFAELFAHADQIDANITYTEKGLRVVETSDDPAVAHLLHMHAAAVDGFITNGMAEMMKKDHPVN